jgi:hypothetical protein
MLRDLLVALSLSNLCFLRIWNELFNGKLTYYAQVPPTHHLLGVVLRPASLHRRQSLQHFQEIEELSGLFRRGTASALP